MFNYEKMQSYISDSGIKQKFIAEQAQLAESTLSLILSGKRKCGVDEYIQICKALGLPFEAFISKQDFTDSSKAG